MVTKVCYVGEGFTRKPPKYERFIRPMVSRLWQHVYCITACTTTFLWTVITVTVMLLH